MIDTQLTYDAMFYYDKLKEIIGNDKEACYCLDKLVEQVMNDAMDFDSYQSFASKGIRNESNGKNLVVGFALGLGGEAGEVIDDIKKREYHGRNVSIEHTAEELGDVLWYVANIAHQLGYKLSDIASKNEDKLLKRYGNLYKEEHYGK